MRGILLAILLATAACGHEKPKPVEIDAGEMCASCKMAISQKKYAAEFIDKDGAAIKFDDIGCMIRFIKEHEVKINVEAYFVVDYTTHSWLDARSATYVRSSALPSPMGSGLAAFKDRPEAEAFAVKYHGRLLGFDDLWGM